MAGELPFVPPMLARLGEPFDAEDHLFEVKWDGYRALVLSDAAGVRVLSRNQVDFTVRFRAADWLGALPAGTALDGEIVALRDGLPDFEQLQQRNPGPVVFMAFDVLFAGGASLQGEPLVERRKVLADLVAATGHPRIALSDGVVGAGKAFFAQLVARGFEGVVGKRLCSRYEAGQRSGAWTKCKRSESLHCAIIGYVAVGEDLRSLALAAPDATGRLTYVGGVGSGLDGALRSALLPRLRARPRATPLVPCSEPASWVEPGLYCTVKFVERTRSGHLRAPVFLDWAEA